MTIPRSRTLAALSIALAACWSASPALAQSQSDVCGSKPPSLPPITNDILDECRIDALAELGSVYSEAADYYWCQWRRANMAKTGHYDEALYQLVQAEIDFAKATVNGAKASLKGPKGGKDLAHGMIDMASGLRNLAAAREPAQKAAAASELQDEMFRMSMNAMHQAENAARVAERLEEKAASDPDCPPPEDDGPQDDGVVFTYSGFGMTVTVTRDNVMRIESDCRDPDHRIQVRGPTGTWAAKGVGVPVTEVPDINPTLTYEVRRRCDHEYSEVLVIDLPD